MIGLGTKNLSEIVPGFGEEIKDLKFKNWLDWFIYFRSPKECWDAQPTYLASELTFLIIGVLTFVHSQRVGGRWKWLWLATIIHGIVVECAAYWLPDIDNFWHSLTMVTLLGRRLPIHIMFLYPTFIYNASCAVARLKLPNWAEPFAVGLTVVLIDIPYDIMCVNFLHWTWHDTDPNIADRFYWVPWNSFYFHATFAASFTFFFHFWKRVIIGQKPSDSKWRAGTAKQELICATLTGLCGMPGGVLQFIPLYHPLHDIFKIHSENCFFMLAATFLFIAWSADRQQKDPSARLKVVSVRSFLRRINENVISLMLHYSCYLGIVIFGKPENEVSTGPHEKLGPCNEIVPVQTVFGMTLEKRKYLCSRDYDEKYFDFHCLPDGKIPEDGSEWYTICGVPLPNRAEYIAIIGTICWVAFLVFGNMFFLSGQEEGYYNSKKDVSELKKRK
ncbi:uncharacterized protein LOC136030926 [Artemia franciscana]